MFIFMKTIERTSTTVIFQNISIYLFQKQPSRTVKMLILRKTLVVESYFSKNTSLNPVTLQHQDSAVYIFLGVYTRAPANSCSCIYSRRATIFDKTQVFCKLFLNISYYISLFEAFHCFILKNQKPLYLFMQVFLLLEKIMVPFRINTEILIIFFQIFFSLFCMKVKLREKLVLPL